MVMTSFHTWCLLWNSSEGLDIAGGRRSFFYRQLSSRRVITMLAAGWAEAWSCQALAAAIQKNLYFSGYRLRLQCGGCPS